MKTQYLLIVSLFAFACKAKTKSAPHTSIAHITTGTYTSLPKLSKWDWIPLFMNGYRSQVLGMKLIINADSTFRLQTCSSIETGTWKLQDEKLYLYDQTIRWKNDSLQQFGYKGKWLPIPKAPMVFTISDGSMLQRDLNLPKGKKALEMLSLKM